MGNKKGGLGTAAAPPAQDDLTSSLFAVSAKKRLEQRPAQARASRVTSDHKQGQDRIGKTLHIDRELAVQLKIYAAKNGLKEHQVIDAALRKFLTGKME